jgi:FKBP-type peptidyl-prolyl cis-trans isomerase
LATAVACSSERQAQQSGEETAVSQPSSQPSAPPPVTGDTIATSSGLQYIVLQSGEGTQAEQGKVVSVHYTGWLTDGTKFDSSVDRNQPIRFPVGTGHVIPGWDEAVGMMRVGDRWRIILPPDIAYGAQGRPPVIPPSSTLIFDVELVGVDDQ